MVRRRNDHEKVSVVKKKRESNEREDMVSKRKWLPLDDGIVV